jgi:hypothetical protein
MKLILSWLRLVFIWIRDKLIFICRKIRSFFKRFTISAGWTNNFEFILLGLKIMTREEMDTILVFEIRFLKAHFAIYFE